MLVFWILCSILTVAVIVILARPLASHAAPGVETGGPEPAHLAVYRDQLAEIEADKARGAITADEADAARTEVGRRLLAEAGRLDAAGSGVANEDRRTTKRAIYTIAAAIPLLALTLYLSVGSPGMPSQSAAERTTRDAIANADIEQMIANDNDEADEGSRAGANGYIMKPLNAQSLKTKLSGVIGSFPTVNCRTLEELGQTMSAAEFGLDVA